ncbi:hypothetical protein ACFS07_02165 [Undibacterium arcticum]
MPQYGSDRSWQKYSGGKPTGRHRWNHRYDTDALIVEYFVDAIQIFESRKKHLHNAACNIRVAAEIEVGLERKTHMHR